MPGNLRRRITIHLFFQLINKNGARRSRLPSKAMGSKSIAELMEIAVGLSKNA